MEFIMGLAFDALKGYLVKQAKGNQGMIDGINKVMDGVDQMWETVVPTPNKTTDVPPQAPK